MTLDQISARYEGHPFLDYFDCLTASLEAAKRRNKLAVQARRAGDEVGARRHQVFVKDYMLRVRQWHAMIDWSSIDG